MRKKSVVSETRHCLDKLAFLALVKGRFSAWGLPVKTSKRLLLRPASGSCGTTIQLLLRVNDSKRTDEAYFQGGYQGVPDQREKAKVISPNIRLYPVF